MSGLPLVGDEFAGYRVRSVLGRGGMSVVYQAENLRLSSVIALKVWHPSLPPTMFSGPGSWRNRGSRPRSTTDVIPIYDMGSQRRPAVHRDAVRLGDRHAEITKKRGLILPAAALFLVGQAARALDAAHRKGLVHRDESRGTC